MPRKAIDYSTTIIYKIVCKDLEVTEVYVGHTTSFKDRKTTHKSACNNENNKSYNFKVYKYIRENGGWENFDMIEIEKFSECKDSNEALARERYWYEQLNAKLNMIFPQRTDEEIKQYFKKYNKQYFNENKEYFKEYTKEYNIKYYEGNKEEKKEYYKNNKDKLKEQQYLKFKQRTNTPYTCSCGWVGNENSKYLHLKNSVQHKEYLAHLEV